MHKMSIKSKMDAILRRSFPDAEVQVVDESEQHKGHAGYREGGESHFRVRIKSKQLNDMSRIDRHRHVYNVIGSDLISELHALALELDSD